VNDTPVAERRVRLAPAPESTREARRILREALELAGRERWLSDAELALSEIVTNAVLHAHTEIDVHVKVTHVAARVEVRDFNPAMPVARNYGEEALTGRGMALVAAVTQASGVERVGESGKVVWFCVGDEEGESTADLTVDDLLAAWDDDGWDDAVASSGDVVDVVLRDMPVRLWLAAREHHDAIVRDLGYYVARHQGLDLDLAGTDRARSTISESLVELLDREFACSDLRIFPVVGRDAAVVPDDVDLELGVAADSAPLFSTMQDVLDIAEDLAARGLLLVQPALPEVVAVRDWACEQVIAQISGAPSAPWPGTARAHFETEVRERQGESVEWDEEAVTGAGCPAVAVDSANRIVAANDELARLVGWDVDELVGRRVVTLVPPRFREAHVAGFTRFLSTGERKVLGQSLQLPLFTRDGREVDVTLRIETAAGDSGVLFIATMEPGG